MYMPYSFKVRRSSSSDSTLNLGNRTKYMSVEADGIAAIDVAVTTTSNVYTAGGVFSSAHTNTRSITLRITFRRFGALLAADRAELYTHFVPGEKIRLYIKSPTRQAYTDCYVEKIEDDIFTSDRQVMQVSLIAPYPYFISQSSSTATLAQSAAQTIVSGSDVREGVTITITATSTISNPYIRSSTTAQKMTVNANVTSDQTLTICTKTGSKSITLSDGSTTTNILGKLDTDSDWLEIMPGTNLLYFGCGTGSGATAKIVYSSIYTGV